MPIKVEQANMLKANITKYSKDSKQSFRHHQHTVCFSLITVAHFERRFANLISMHLYYTVFRKNTHSRFLLYLCGKCLDLHKIFRECSAGNKYSEGGKIKYSLLSVTAC